MGAYNIMPELWSNARFLAGNWLTTSLPDKIRFVTIYTIIHASPVLGRRFDVTYQTHSFMTR